MGMGITPMMAGMVLEVIMAVAARLSLALRLGIRVDMVWVGMGWFCLG